MYSRILDYCSCKGWNKRHNTASIILFKGYGFGSLLVWWSERMWTAQPEIPEAIIRLTVMESSRSLVSTFRYNQSIVRFKMFSENTG